MRSALLVGLLTLALAGRAEAGSCPTCAQDSDCPPADFCVVHEADVGCGADRSLCCPGQGCALGGDGRPTCEAAGTCAVMCGTADDCPTPGDGCLRPAGGTASWCVTSDPNCPTGQRWSETAGDGLALMCVTAPPPVDAGPRPDGPGGNDGGGDGGDAGCGCAAGARGAGGGGAAVAAGLLLAAYRRCSRKKEKTRRQ